MRQIERPSVLLIDPRIAAAFPEEVAALRALPQVHALEVDHQQLFEHVAEIRTALATAGSNLLIFTQGEQSMHKVLVGKLLRELGTGYTTLSAIDRDDVLKQSRAALRDYAAGRGSIEGLQAPAPIRPAGPAAPTFSLVFDTEQVAGVKFGLPRLLNLMGQSGTRATFFITGLMIDLFPDLVPILLERGHEIAPHGLYHEDLSRLSPEAQADSARQMAAQIRETAGHVEGANLIYRMNEATVSALAGAGLRYFVLYAEHHFRPMAFQPAFLEPLQVDSPGGSLILFPVSAETYGREWPMMRAMLRSAMAQVGRGDWKHITLLLHPFRDGSLAHFADFEKMLTWLLRQGWQGVPLAEKLAQAAARPLPRIDASQMTYNPLKFLSAPQPRPRGLLPGLDPEQRRPTSLNDIVGGSTVALYRARGRLRRLLR